MRLNGSVIGVENTGSSSVEYAEICIIQGGCELRFKLSALPAGATGVIQEASRLAPATSEIESCTADVATTEMGMAESQVQVADNGSNGLPVWPAGCAAKSRNRPPRICLLALPL